MDALGGNSGMGVPDMMGAPMGGDPMMGDPNAMGGDPNAMGGDPNMMGDTGDLNMNDPDNPELDNRKEVEILAGRLGTALRKLNNEEGPDEEASLSAINTVVAAGREALTDKGKQKVVNKVKNGGDIEEDNNSEGFNESILRKNLLEIINSVINPEAPKGERSDKKIKNKSLNKSRSPFVAGR